jgi:hypothetical protein
MKNYMTKRMSGWRVGDEGWWAQVDGEEESCERRCWVKNAIVMSVCKRRKLIKMLLALTFCLCWNCSLLRALSREIALLRKIEQTHTHVLSSAKPSMLHWVFSPNLQTDKKLRVMYSTWQLTAAPSELVPPHARASYSWAPAPNVGPWNTRHMLEEYKLTRLGSKSLWNKVLQERSDSYNKNIHKISLIRNV